MKGAARITTPSLLSMALLATFVCVAFRKICTVFETASAHPSDFWGFPEQRRTCRPKCNLPFDRQHQINAYFGYKVSFDSEIVSVQNGSSRFLSIRMHMCCLRVGTERKSKRIRAKERVK